MTSLFSSPIATGTITSLYIYPIKSCRGIPLASSLLTRRGLDLDRNWMFVSGPSNKFITIRDISALTLIDTSLSPNPPAASSQEDLVISIRTKPGTSVRIPARPTKEWLGAHTTLEKVEIWENETDGWIYDSSINDMFRDFLGEDVKLAYKGPSERILRGNGAPAELGRTESTNFPDVLPVLMANERSLEELNGRLREKGVDEITIERFRPNIVVRGAPDALPAWSEDSWKTLQVLNGPPAGERSLLGKIVGGSVLKIDVMARCARCQVPNVDPETGGKDRKEPWDTLVSYRRVDEGIKWKPCFGMLSCPRGEGVVEVGMEFEVVEKTEGHVYIKGF